MTKFNKTEANYLEEAPNEKQCSDCVFYLGQACRVVEGEISPKAICQYHQPQVKEQSKEEKKVEEIKDDPGVVKMSQLTYSPILLSNKLVRIPLAKKGRFHHEKHGIVEFTDRDFQDIIDNANSKVLGFEEYLTYGHPRTEDEKKSYLEEARAIDAERKQGKLTKLSVKGETLYGDYEVNDRTYGYIKDKEYEYNSGEFIRNYRDKKSGRNLGTVLVRTALTNAPFIPFGNDKVQALSNNAEESLPDITSFVIRLSSVDNNESLNMPEENQKAESKTTEEVKTEVVEEKGQEVDKKEEKEEVVSETPQKESKVETKATVEVEEVKTETPKETTEAKPESVKQSTEKPEDKDSQMSAPQIDINSIIKQVTDSVKESMQESYESKLESKEKELQTLSQTVEDLKKTLEKQQEVTQSFSSTLSNQERQERYSHMAAQGIPPALIQRFSEVENAMGATASSVLKFSTGENEVAEKSVLTTVTELMVEALNTQPVRYDQLGQSLSVADPTGLNTAIRAKIDQIKANKQVVQ